MDWDTSHDVAIVANLKWGDNENKSVVINRVEVAEKANKQDKAAKEGVGSDINGTEENLSNSSEGHSPSSHEERERKRSVWMRDYVIGEGLLEEVDVAY